MIFELAQEVPRTELAEAYRDAIESDLSREAVSEQAESALAMLEENGILEFVEGARQNDNQT
ncbi:MAG: hypothetical protein MI861_11940 [Pirellulales bacterium]|nr:hypothetical protein [Pirellulales bacterium]